MVQDKNTGLMCVEKESKGRASGRKRAGSQSKSLGVPKESATLKKGAFRSRSQQECETVSRTENNETGKVAKKRTTTKRNDACTDVGVPANQVPKKAKTSSQNKELGRRGEEAAVRFLERHGYEIVERNWSCCAGEVDIIARDEETIVFIEVKTRSNLDKGLPAEAVNAQKRVRYEKIAALFLAGYEVVDVSVRFDVIAILVIAPERALIRHHINAFSVG